MSFMCIKIKILPRPVEGEGGSFKQRNVLFFHTSGMDSTLYPSLLPYKLKGNLLFFNCAELSHDVRSSESKCPRVCTKIALIQTQETSVENVVLILIPDSYPLIV